MLLKVKVSVLIGRVPKAAVSHGGSSHQKKKNRKRGKMGVLHGLTWNKKTGREHVRTRLGNTQRSWHVVLPDVHTEAWLYNEALALFLNGEFPTGGQVRPVQSLGCVSWAGEWHTQMLIQVPVQMASACHDCPWGSWESTLCQQRAASSFTQKQMLRLWLAYYCHLMN